MEGRGQVIERSRINRDLSLRVAVHADIAEMERLIARSARALSRGYYTDVETEVAVARIFGVDSDLVADGSYYVVTTNAGVPVACGGWSRRATLFGGDRFAGREADLLDPCVDAARIRAFFVAPEAARAGVGSRLLRTSEEAAAARGFVRTTLMATLPGVPFYAAHGYVAGEPIVEQCGDCAIRFVPMHKKM